MIYAIEYKANHLRIDFILKRAHVALHSYAIMDPNSFLGSNFIQ